MCFFRSSYAAIQARFTRNPRASSAFQRVYIRTYVPKRGLLLGAPGLFFERGRERDREKSMIFRAREGSRALDYLPLECRSAAAPAIDSSEREKGDRIAPPALQCELFSSLDV